MLHMINKIKAAQNLSANFSIPFLEAAIIENHRIVHGLTNQQVLELVYSYHSILNPGAFKQNSAIVIMHQRKDKLVCHRYSIIPFILGDQSVFQKETFAIPGAYYKDITPENFNSKAGKASLVKYFCPNSFTKIGTRNMRTGEILPISYGSDGRHASAKIDGKPEIVLDLHLSPIVPDATGVGGRKIISQGTVFSRGDSGLSESMGKFLVMEGGMYRYETDHIVIHYSEKAGIVSYKNGKYHFVPKFNPQKEMIEFDSCSIEEIPIFSRGEINRSHGPEDKLSFSITQYLKFSSVTMTLRT